MRWPKDRLTRFEVARILGARTLQISLGAPVLVKTTKDDVDPLQIAEKEFKEGKVPMTVKRPMPDGSKDVIDIKPAIKSWLEDYDGI